MGASSNTVKATLSDGDVELRLDFNSIGPIEDFLGQPVADFFTDLGKKGANESKKMLARTDFLRTAIHAGSLWATPEGEPQPTVESIARRMELKRMAEYSGVVMDMFLVSFGLTDSQGATRKALQTNRRTRGKATKKKTEKASITT